MRYVNESAVRERLKRERISRDKEYEMISSRVGEVWSSSHDAVKLFIQIFSAIVGGSIWLRTQHAATNFNYALVSDTLALIVFLLCGTILWDNQGTWSQWRERLDKVTNGAAVVEIPFPSGKGSIIRRKGMEGVSTLVMLAALVMFCVFNPFKSTPHACRLESWTHFGAYIHWFGCVLT